jgi:hypothetical protein
VRMFRVRFPYRLRNCAGGSESFLQSERSSPTVGDRIASSPMRRCWSCVQRASPRAAWRTACLSGGTPDSRSPSQGLIPIQEPERQIVEEGQRHDPDCPTRPDVGGMDPYTFFASLGMNRYRLTGSPWRRKSLPV